MFVYSGTHVAVAEAPSSYTPLKLPENTLVVETYTPTEILREIAKLANGDKVLYNKMALISHCESNYQNIQSRIVKDGKREESYGIAQIHLPSHPHITKQQALDVKFSLQFLKDEILAGNEWKWYGWRGGDKCAWQVD
jgi:hypothetical protein